MPLWNNVDFVESLSRHSVPIEVITATVMLDAEATQAIALPPTPDGQGLDLAFEVRFASNPPGTVDYRLQVAFNNVAAEFQDVSPFMTNSETIGDIIAIGDIVGRFARVLASDADSVAVTITIMVQ